MYKATVFAWKNDKKFPAYTRDCWIILYFQLQNSGETRKEVCRMTF